MARPLWIGRSATTTAQNTALNASEYEAMNDIEIGLTGGPIAEYRGISGVATTPRRHQRPEPARAVAIALTSRKVNSRLLDMAQKELASLEGCLFPE